LLIAYSFNKTKNKKIAQDVYNKTNNIT